MSSDLEALAAAVRGRHANSVRRRRRVDVRRSALVERAHRRMCAELHLDPNAFPAAETGYHTLAEYYRLQIGSIGPLSAGWTNRGRCRRRACGNRACMS